jgi:DNA-binding response OmpR family regulator
MGQFPKKILVVEDEILVAMFLEDLLIGMGHEVVGPASRLATAMEYARDSAIDFAVLDVNLAGETSFPVAELLRERGVPFVFATGYGTEGMAAGHCDERTLRKPYAAEDLRLAIEFGIAGTLEPT